MSVLSMQEAFGEKRHQKGEQWVFWMFWTRPALGSAVEEERAGRSRSLSSAEMRK